MRKDNISEYRIDEVEEELYYLYKTSRAELGDCNELTRALRSRWDTIERVINGGLDEMLEDLKEKVEKEIKRSKYIEYWL